jgi:sulfatase modifying factor 1
MENQHTWAEEHADYTETVNGISFTMIAVKGGEFTMGDMFGDSDDNSETPHQVTVSDYFLGETTVTQDLWYAVMRNNPSDCSGSDDLPVENVSWEDAQEFIQRLNGLTGQSFRLPTEAEWEFAARERGRKVRFGNGKDVADPEEMNFDGSHAENCSVQGVYRGETTSVKLFPPNALGLYDMSGNVWEWCEDWYDIYPQKPPNDPKGPDHGDFRVRRGGSWFDFPNRCRVSYREVEKPDYCMDDTGFRLASE